MKSNFLFFIVLLSTQLCSQNFEGSIVYKSSCRSSKPDWKKEYCQMIADSSHVYYFKNGNYKYVYNDIEKWTLFINKEQKMYTKAKKIYRTSVFQNEDEIVNIQINPKKTIVLGYECDELILKCKNSTQKYYYNSVTEIDPKLMEKHQLANLNTIISITKAIPIKTIFIIEDQGFELETVAFEIKKAPLSAALFTLPKEVEIIDGNTSK